MIIGHKCSKSISNLGFAIIAEQKPHKNPRLRLGVFIRFLFRDNPAASVTNVYIYTSLLYNPSGNLDRQLPWLLDFPEEC